MRCEPLSKQSENLGRLRRLDEKQAAPLGHVERDGGQWSTCCRESSQLVETTLWGYQNLPNAY